MVFHLKDKYDYFDRGSESGSYLLQFHVSSVHSSIFNFTDLISTNLSLHRQTAKVFSPPIFPAIRYVKYIVIINNDWHDFII